MNYYFYDLETTGFMSRRDRIMQFAGQRTDMNFKPIGDADNILVKLSGDVLPQPDAVLTHGITPQKARADGMREADFMHYFNTKVLKPNTIFVGYNNIRFDDEFMRYCMWRNFYDSYEWQWKDGCSKWDLLDVARMCRALRPDGVKWPYKTDGKETVSLEKLASINGLEHENAHDALSDVKALIALARLLSLKQPKLYNYLLNIRTKDKVSALVNSGVPIIYTSGRYPSEYLKTTVVIKIGALEEKQNALMFDLRVDPRKFSEYKPSEVAKLWLDRSKEAEYFPVKKLSYNRCPAIAPLNVLTDEDKKRLNINIEDVERNLKCLQSLKDFGDKFVEAHNINFPPDQPKLAVDQQTVDEQLYNGFVAGSDKTKMSVVRASDSDTIRDLDLDFDDERLKLLLPLYKARNYPDSLNATEINLWNNFRRTKFFSGGSKSLEKEYKTRLAELKKTKLTNQQKQLLKEVELYAKQILNF